MTQKFFSLLFLVVGLLTMALNAQAGQTSLATIENDENNNIYKLVIESKDEREISRFIKETYTEGKLVKKETLDHSKLSQGGIVLEKRKNYDVIVLKSHNFDLERGGTIEVDTLYNGANKERKKYELEISKSKNGWNLFNRGKEIRKITVLTNKVVILGVVGIKNLVMK